MHMLFFNISMVLEPVFLVEKPKKLLEISMYGSSGCRYGRLVKDVQARVWGTDVEAFTDRIDIDEKLGADGQTEPYRRILPLEALDHPQDLDDYDIILIADLLEYLDANTAKALLLELCTKARNQVYVIAPDIDLDKTIFQSEGIKYFKTSTVEAEPENVRIYSVSCINSFSRKIQEERSCS